MKYKAVISFCGSPVSMSAGDVREIDDKNAEALVRCGYLVPAEEAPGKTPEKTPVKQPKKPVKSGAKEKI